jgi:mxaJ protein
MTRAAVGFALGILLTGSAFGAELKELRVCADPANLPYSNERQEGFENKLAELVAQDLGVPLRYFWWPHQRGLVRNTLGADKCDVLIGIPKGYDLVTWTKPYYRSAYVFTYLKARGLGLRALDDPSLRTLRIGVHRGTPAEDVLAEKGVIENVVSYPLFHDPRDQDPAHLPTKLVEDVIAGTLDVAVVWGPWAGYYVKKQSVAVLEVVPIEDAGSIPTTFEVSMGVKKGQRELKALLEGVIDRRQAEIRQVLDQYGVPLLALKPPSASPPPPGAGAPGWPSKKTGESQ